MYWVGRDSKQPLSPAPVSLHTKEGACQGACPLTLGQRKPQGTFQTDYSASQNILTERHRITQSKQVNALRASCRKLAWKTVFHFPYTSDLFLHTRWSEAEFLSKVFSLPDKNPLDGNIPHPLTQHGQSRIPPGAGAECVGGWQIRHGDLGCYCVLRFPKCKQKQISRKFFAKLTLTLNRNLTIDGKACATCVCWWHRELLLSTCADFRFCNSSSPIHWGYKNYKPQQILINSCALLSQASPTILSFFQVLS